jgi:hypothetical protein
MLKLTADSTAVTEKSRSWSLAAIANGKRIASAGLTFEWR